MRWKPRQLRGNRVYMRVDDDGKPLLGPDGRVDIVYRIADNAKIYRASHKNLEVPADDDEIVEANIGSPTQAKPGPSTGGTRADPVPGDAVIIYTDGACTGNPGPMGIGAVILDGDERVEISEYLGEGTNNIAELTAILRALERLDAKQRARSVVLHSDSSYSIGLLTKNWKAKANKELVAQVRAAVAGLPHLRFVKVKGHAGVPENERCDELARQAIDEST